MYLDLLFCFTWIFYIVSPVNDSAYGGPDLNEAGTPPALDFQQFNSRFLFPVHFLLRFSALSCSLFPPSVYLISPFTCIFP